MADNGQYRLACRNEWYPAIPNDLPARWFRAMVRVADAMGADGRGHVSYRQIALAANISENTAYRAVCWARDHGWLRVVRRGGRRGTQTVASTYQLTIPNSPVSWGELGPRQAAPNSPKGKGELAPRPNSPKESGGLGRSPTHHFDGPNSPKGSGDPLDVPPTGSGPNGPPPVGDYERTPNGARSPQPSRLEENNVINYDGSLPLPGVPVPPRKQPARRAKRSDQHNPTTQTLLGEWIDMCAQRPPARVIGQVARELKLLLDEGIAVANIRRGVAHWHQRRLHPSALASCVHEAMNGGPKRRPPHWHGDRVRSAARAEVAEVVARGQPPAMALNNLEEFCRSQRMTTHFTAQEDANAEAELRDAVAEAEREGRPVLQGEVIRDTPSRTVRGAIVR